MNIEDKFWEFVDRINWQSYIGSGGRINFERLILEKSAPFYSFDECIKFKQRYDNIYHSLYSKFESTWLSDEYDFMPSDDGYTDLISSIIGKGKDFCYNITDDDFIKMAENDDYRENFGYLFHKLDRKDFKEEYISIYTQSKRNEKLEEIGINS